jgi:tRNA 2-selenouridine synthase
MTRSDIISPQDALQRILQQPEQAALDVRSESEWAEGAIPGFHNDPILINSERQAVGLCYKQQGQEAAFALGHQLTAPYKIERVARWQHLASGQSLMVACWRGGARSRLACEWLSEAGLDTLRVRGGYKSMRAVLREQLENPPPLLVLSGATGTGKTRLLRELAVAKVDLEAYANHRGSAFGGLGAQPAQQTFENRIALQFFAGFAEYLIEDESRLIGVNQLPLNLKEQMYVSPTVVLELPMSERVALTHDEYVLQPLRQGSTLALVQQQLQHSLDRIAKRLGSQRHLQLSNSLTAAMLVSADRDAHARWIEPLLADYYDPRYHHAFNSQPRQVLFRGDRAACREFLLARFAAHQQQNLPI